MGLPFTPSHPATDDKIIAMALTSALPADHLKEHFVQREQRCLAALDFPRLLASMFVSLVDSV